MRAHNQKAYLTRSVLSVLTFTVLMMGVCGMAGAPAYAESADARLSRIERDIDTLSQSVFKGQNPRAILSSGAHAAQELQNQFDARVTQLEQDLRDLTNKTEEQGNTIRQLNESISNLVSRLSALEQKTVSPPTSIIPSSGMAPVVSTGAAVSTTTSGPLPVLADPNGAAPANSPTVQPMGTMTTNASTGEPSVSTTDPTFMYENALELLKQRDYVLAEKSLTDFLAQNPTHPLTPNAKYWLGETYFVQGKFDDSARVFAEGYQRYPKGTKAPDNLLKLGLSLSATNKIPDACVALKQIAKDFPNGATAVKTRAASEIKKLKCS